MLGKLLKHELRASAREVLPALGVLTVLVFLANLSFRLLQRDPGDFVAILSLLVVFVAMVAVIAAELIPLVPMIQRFHRNLLWSEGYVMHTLPVSVHAQVWAKLIAFVIWLVVTNLVLLVLGSLSLLHLSDMGLNQFLEGLPSMAEIRAALESNAEAAAALRDGLLLLAEFLVNCVLLGLVILLHVYAAMSLGHMFTRRKGLMSLVFFVAISVLFFAFFVCFFNLMGPRLSGDYTGFQGFVDFFRGAMGLSTLLLLIQAGLLYLATALGLKKGLNLA